MTNHDELRNAHIDLVVTRLYRKFKDWSQLGFGPDDATWCEVRAEIVDALSFFENGSVDFSQQLTGKPEYRKWRENLLKAFAREKEKDSEIMILKEKLCAWEVLGRSWRECDDIDKVLNKLNKEFGI